MNLLPNYNKKQTQSSKMKTFKTLVIALLGLTSVIMTVNGICADVLIDESPQTYQSGSPGVFTNTSLTKSN